MKIIRANVLGFCMGVRRAVDLAYGEIACVQAASSAGRVYTLGPLIHNPQVLDELKRRGAETLDESLLPQNLHNASVIIRAHGVGSTTGAELRGRGAKVIDATCPRVKASQLKAAALAESGYRLFLAGEEYHAEITGVRSYAETGFSRRDTAYSGAIPFCVVVGSAAEAQEAAAGLFAQDSAAKTALIGQTTISGEEYRAIGETIRKYFPALEIIQTICSATTDRQDSLRELLGKVEAVIIAGGKDSANTRRLFAIAEAAGKPCALAETAADIPPGFAVFETVGLCAGASTPDTAIDEIERALELGNS